ncbi:MAG: putative calnexin [Streblomastix strix]|uniref:Putative calnexin n=1 Tax=Streblomastix strix TaxID=222440 RepID=A0A5J4UVM8_9EUKA|nr:MAG: putative calnexin [Streblomastix strix]
MNRFSKNSISKKYQARLGSLQKTQNTMELGLSMREMIIKYEVTTQNQPHLCGGAYMKVYTKQIDPKELNSTQPYFILFGPDHCGKKNKILFHLHTMDPQSGNWTYRKMVSGPPALFDNLTHIYTLILNLKKDSIAILVDGDVKLERKIIKQTLIDMDNEEKMKKEFNQVRQKYEKYRIQNKIPKNPPTIHRYPIPLFDASIFPPRLIPDPKHIKPSNWVDEKFIPDEKDVKPSDWDGDDPNIIPQFIQDPEDEKPDDWNEDIPLNIPDNEAAKPQNWNEIENGSWNPPLIPNPQCQNNKCGKWEPKLIPNKDFRVGSVNA